MKLDKEIISWIILIILIASGYYLLGYYRSYENYKYYKEKSKKEQRLLWRISYTFPEQWELITNTPEYHQCIQYNIEDVNEY